MHFTHSTLKFASVVLLGALVFGCKTNDVDPTLNKPTCELSVDNTSIGEALGSAVITATIDNAIEADIEISVSISGTATADDYTVSSNKIVITKGNLTGTLTLFAVQDTLEEGNETIVVTATAADNALIGSSSFVQITVEDDDVPFQAQIIINEICYDPSNNALDGDANGDGVYAQADDEFLELINLSSVDVDLAGWTIYDASSLSSGTPNHTFPANSIVPSGKAIVIFGGGTPTGSFGGALVQTSTSGDFNMTNAGDLITIKDAEGNVVITFDIEPLSNNPNESYTRSPDITGDFVQSTTVGAAKFSPGTKIDGSAF